MSSFTRRDFIKGLSLSAAAMVAAPVTVPGSALGLDGGVSANERVAMGVVGCGSHSRTWTATLSAPVSRCIRTCQPLDQHLSAALSAPISCLISPCQPLDQQLSAACYAPVSSLISA